MNKLLKDSILKYIAPSILIFIALVMAYRFIDPAPPNKIIISTSVEEGDYQYYAKLYKEIIHDDKVELILRPSTGAVENLQRLKDPNSDIDAGFMQDGIGSAEEAPDLVSLGSLYYEPIWIFYRATHAAGELTKLSQLVGKKIAIGKEGGGTSTLATKLLKQGGADESNTTFIYEGWSDAASALTTGKVDAIFIIASGEDALIKKLMADLNLKLMTFSQAEAITKHFPFLHHLVLPHGTFDLKNNIPAQDIHLVSPTATLVVRDSLHPSLVFLLMKAISQIHNEPGIFEKKDEFPIDKDYEFPLSDAAKHFYKSGIPFWQRYLPFWVATMVDRFILVILPLLILLYPLLRLIPRFLTWRVRSRIYKNYGELKYLETQMKQPLKNKNTDYFTAELDRIEEQVNALKLPLEFSDHYYVLREHIDYVRARLQRII